MGMKSKVVKSINNAKIPEEDKDDFDSEVGIANLALNVTLGPSTSKSKLFG